MKNYERLSETYLGKSAVIERKTVLDDVDTHWHGFYEIEFIHSGECTFMINGQTYRGKSGDMFVLNLSDFHEIRLHSQELELFTLHFKLDYINASLLSYLLHSETKKLTFEEEQIESIEYLFGLLEKENHTNLDFGTVYARSLLNAILVNVCRNIQSLHTDIPVLSNNPVKLAANYIQLNFQEAVKLDDIAEYAHCSPSYISRLFHEHMGMTIKSYLTELRLDYAAKMLEFSETGVTDICYLSGFGDFSNFWRAFTNKYKYSPREYRTARSQKTIADS